ncbi:aromatic-ring-hydroxylating dioxygenase subunit beta [Paraburkholderia sp. ZP32-5]|uniref:aromatic-ring-hydroxylating dioxygenase subunit beta n=1 Tax=Paraburkholderia sp. ZP32-5 TaxID=2883245 RepID=UPI001F3C5C47|nr:aromatic-ring-hydroxylating dioxygenase subunit beta [Paraburkholderia sp. ZP32-5]
MINADQLSVRPVTRAEVEDFLFAEAELLDTWQLDAWLQLLTDDAAYLVPSNDAPQANHRDALFTIADNAERIRQRVIRIKDPNCHAEFPKSRTRRLLANVRIVEQTDEQLTVTANFVCYRYRRYERIREYVGQYRYVLARSEQNPHGLLIRERRVLLDAHELGSLGSVSFIL